MRKPARWERLSGPRVEKGSYNRAVCWTYELGAGTEKVKVAVEATKTALAGVDLKEPAASAIGTKGWAAIQPYLSQRHLPRRLLVTVQGVSVSEEGDD